MLDKRILISTIAVFATFAVYGFLTWGVLLADIMHHEMGNVWRPEDAIEMPWIFIAYIVMAYPMVLIWKYGQEDKGVAEGVRYGLMAGALVGATRFIAYAVQPITLKGALMAFGIDLVMFVVAGVVLSIVYKALGAK